LFSSKRSKQLDENVESVKPFDRKLIGVEKSNSQECNNRQSKRCEEFDHIKSQTYHHNDRRAYHQSSPKLAQNVHAVQPHDQSDQGFEIKEQVILRQLEAPDFVHVQLLLRREVDQAFAVQGNVGFGWRLHVAAEEEASEDHRCLIEEYSDIQPDILFHRNCQEIPKDR